MNHCILPPSSECPRLKTKAFRTAEMMLALVLPSGFPSSVRHPYSTYAAWQFTAMTASAAAGVMSTQALVSNGIVGIVVAFVGGGVGAAVVAFAAAPRQHSSRFEQKVAV